MAYQSGGSVGFIPSTVVTPPLDPNQPLPEEPVQPIGPNGELPAVGTAGPLSLDFASNLSFGNHEIVNRDVVYSAKAQGLTQSDGSTTAYVPNYVQVTDNRGTNAGWALQVKQNGQFTATTKTTNSRLIGASIQLNQPTVIGVTNSVAPMTNEVSLDPEGNSTVIMSASVGSGSGTWLTRWGNQKSLVTEEQMTADALAKEAVMINPAVTLSVPGKTPRDAVKYSTTLVWTLTNVPATGSSVING
jgi:hypothetical protein